MAPTFRESSKKHGFTERDITYAIANATFVRTIEQDAESDVVLFIGPEHAQTKRELEVLVRQFHDGRPAWIFHAMNLTDKFARYREQE